MRHNGGKVGLGKLLVIAFLGWGGASAADAVALEGAYVFHVEVAGCKTPPERRAQTGFRLRGRPGIVTALHGVVGCSRITARRTAGESQAISDLAIELVDLEHDLALLLSPALRDDRGLEMARALPNGPAAVRVLGHPSNVPGLLEMEMAVPSPAVRLLGDLVPPELYAALESRKSPSVKSRVISLNGDLQPGHSGAPVLDRAGKVVGIANGGLARGTVGIGWAMVLKDVTWSQPSPRVLSELGGRPSKLIFAYDSLVDPDLPLDLTLRGGEQKTFLDDRASVAVEFSQIGGEKFVTLHVGTVEGESVPHAVLSSGERYTFHLDGVEYSVYVLSVEETAKTVRVRINRGRSLQQTSGGVR